MATSVAVSKARISTPSFCNEAGEQCPVGRLDGDAPHLRCDVLETDGRPRSRECARPGLRPLDEDDRAVEVRLEVAPLRRRESAEAIEVEMRDSTVPR